MRVCGGEGGGRDGEMVRVRDRRLHVRGPASGAAQGPRRPQARSDAARKHAVHAKGGGAAGRAEGARVPRSPAQQRLPV